MPKWGEHEAWVSTENHKKVPELGVTVEEPVHAGEDPVVVSCWIPSELGKSFKVYLRTGILTDSGCHLYIDGQRCGKKHKEAINPDRNFHFTGKRTTMSIKHPFIFSRMQTTDEEGLDVSSASDSQGTIALHAHELQYMGGLVPKLHYDALPQSQVLNERSKKAIDHSVTFGAPKRTGDVIYGRPTRITRKAVTFIFKYRPIEVLKANGIAAAASQAKVEVVEISDSDDDTSEEEDEASVLRERIAELEREAELVKLRKRVADLEKGSGRRSKRLKTEHARVKTEAGPSS